MTDLDLDQVWEESWGASYAATLSGTTVPPDEWRRAGKATKDKPDKESLAWWYDAGRGQVQAYADWLASSGWAVAVMPDGRPAVELELTVWFGGMPVKAYIDVVYSSDADLWVVGDIKTGSHTPSPHQLGLYAAMLERAYGQRPAFGSYFMTRKGELSGAHDLDRFTPEYWDGVFGRFALSVQGRLFLPRVSRDCDWCDVRQFCRSAGGDEADAWDVDYEWEIPAHGSWSQLSTFSDCGIKYKLSRLARVDTTPAVWFVAGTAVHSAVEQINLDSVQMGADDAGF